MRQFWDMESYDNLFCAAFIDDNDLLEVHYLVNNPFDAKKVERACRDSGYEYKLYDLTKDATRFAEHMRIQVPSLGKDSLLAEFLGLEEDEVAPKVDKYIAYNSLSYDIQMWDFFKKTIVAGRTHTTPETLRAFSDTLINDTAKRVRTTDYEMYGNQIDAGYLNEKMVDRGRIIIGLKTLVGMMGGSIIESESNKTGHSKDVYADILYCINDVAELKDVVYLGSKMEITQTVRESLLQAYESLSRKNITVNASSAKFVENIIAPDTPIVDSPTVTFMYPAAHIAKERGIEQFDMLEYFKDWYVTNVYNQVVKHNPKVANEHYAKFMSIYNFYASFRGKNWNDSTNHVLRFKIPAEPKTKRRELLDTFGTYLPLIDRYGVDSNTHVNFSIGGIHGAEIFGAQLEQDKKKIKKLRNQYKYISKIPKGEVSQALLNLIKNQSRTSDTGYPTKLLHEVPYLYNNSKRTDEILHEDDFSVFQCIPTKVREDLISRYKYTSTCHTLHQDFAGYYPMLLINLGVFYDGNGRDVYREIYNHRIAVKAKLKTIPFGTPEWHAVNIEQEGYKLILNSASGVLDGSFDTNVRANNKAIAMRAIGQMITAIIAMAVALEGGKVPSSNTDGIYVYDISEEVNQAILDRELPKLMVTIDPEHIFFVSKDTNNRMESHDGQIVSAKGGMLTAWQGAQIDSRLTHPALIDRVLTIYLQNQDIVNKPIDKKLIKKALEEYKSQASKREFVQMASWVMRPTSGSLFVDDTDTVHKGTLRSWLTGEGIQMSKYNVMQMEPGKKFNQFLAELPDDAPLAEPDTLTRLYKLLGKDEVHKHWPNTMTVAEFEQYKADLLEQGASKIPSVPTLKKAKISNLGDNMKLHLDNSSLIKKTDEEIDEIYNKLNLDSYVDMTAEFTEKWVNVLQPS